MSTWWISSGSRSQQVIDWNSADIDWQGRGWDRGLRGIAFDGERVFIAASNELFVYSPDFKLLASYRNPYLRHCHEIAVYQRRLYLTSTGFDARAGLRPGRATASVSACMSSPWAGASRARPSTRSATTAPRPATCCT